MQKNLGKETLWKRVKLLVRGMLLYNTIYWRRASDGLKPPKLTPAERKRYAPPLNLEVVKPRLNPKARLERRFDMTMRPIGSGAPGNERELAAGEALGPESLTRRRRRKRHRRDLKAFTSPPERSGFFSRLLGR